MKINQFRINKFGEMNRARPLAIYALIIGIIMLFLWSFFLISGLIPESNSRPTEITLHLVVEYCTAIMLIISGIRVLFTKGQGEGMLLLSIGMLFYTLLNSSGYYAEKASSVFIALFVLMLVVAIYLTYFAFHGSPKQ
jgi:hypothetical protein